MDKCPYHQTEYLFPIELVKPDEEDGLIARPLAITDYKKGICQLLGQLTEIGNVDEKKFQERFKEMKAANDMYYVVVIEDVAKSKIIGTATLFVEKKFLHDAGKCGHIEDVVVDTTYRGKNLGKRVITQLEHLGKSLGCYKIILDCSEKNVTFYEKCGFKKKEVQMALYSPKSSL